MKDLGPKFFMGMILGAMEGQTRGGYFCYSIFDPPVDECQPIDKWAYQCPVLSNLSQKVCHAMCIVKQSATCLSFPTCLAPAPAGPALLSGKTSNFIVSPPERN